MRRLRYSPRESYSSAKKVVCKRISATNRDTLTSSFTRSADPFSPMRGIKEILTCFSPLLLPMALPKFKWWILTFFFFKIEEVKTQDERNKKNTDKLFIHPPMHRNANLTMVSVVTDSHVHVRWESQKAFPQQD